MDDDGDYEGIFLKRLPKKLNGKEVFVPNKQDPASFFKPGIERKLPIPKQVDGAKRTKYQLLFHFNTEKWNSSNCAKIRLCDKP